MVQTTALVMSSLAAMHRLSPKTGKQVVAAVGLQRLRLCAVLCARVGLGLLLCWTSLNPLCPAPCRWLHHTSLLWDFQHPRMALLKHPDRQPEYRQVQADREHASCVQHISAYPEAGCPTGCCFSGLLLT